MPWTTAQGQHRDRIERPPSLLGGDALAEVAMQQQMEQRPAAASAIGVNLEIPTRSFASSRAVHLPCPRRSWRVVPSSRPRV